MGRFRAYRLRGAGRNLDRPLRDYARLHPREADVPSAKIRRGLAMEKFGHVLVVDDDGAVRDVLRHILDELGYRVSLAKHGDGARGALDLLDVDLLIADEAVRGERGLLLAAYARSLGVPTLLMSADNEVQRKFAGAEEPFIGKPFRFENFREQVKRVLAMPRGDPGGC